MMKILSVLAVIGLVYGQGDYPCCISVSKWEAIEGFIIATAKNNTHTITKGRSLVSVDGDKKMIYQYLGDETATTKTQLRVLQDFIKNVQYTVDAQKQCFETTITQPWQPSCVPKGSVYVGTNRRGSEDKRLITQSYEVPEFLGFNGYLEVTQDGCIPLSEAIYKDVAGVGEMIDIGFTNFTEGIKDPSVFNVPPECKPPSHVIKVAHGFIDRSAFY